MRNVYCNPFVFMATRYEEYRDGQRVGQGPVSIKIISKVINNCAMFHLEGNLPTRIKQDFGLPVFGIERGDILEDRIQYGRIPDSFSWNDPTDPVVCNIFSNMTCIRFAMMSPLRIVEFS